MRRQTRELAKKNFRQIWTLYIHSGYIWKRGDRKWSFKKVLEALLNVAVVYITRKTILK